MENSIFIKIKEGDLSLQECYDFVTDDSCGGISLFIGTVRNSTKDKVVFKLEFSAYEPMAVKEMKLIATSAIEKFKVHKIAIHHAIGALGIGEVPVIIAVSSAHREAAFKACQYAIDTLKETVPIWKKEFFEDGEIWVNAHP
jgi:molybdopterin synthase catalytic subunit